MRIVLTIICSGILLTVSKLSDAQQRLGDNLGSHKATKSLNLNGKSIVSASAVTIGSNAIASSSVGLQIEGDKAMLLSRVTSLSSIALPVNGMMVYNSADHKIYVYQNNLWSTYGTTALASGRIFIGSAGNAVQGLAVSGDLTLSATGVATIGANKVVNAHIADAAVGSAAILDGEVKTANIATGTINTDSFADGTVATGDLGTSSITLGKVANNAVTPAKISTSTAGANKILFTDASSNLAYFDHAKRILPPMSQGQVIVGSSTGIPTAVTVNGDLAVDAAGVSLISPEVVTSAMVVDGTIATADIADNAVSAEKISSTTNGPNKVLKTDAAGVAGWYNKTTNSNGYNVGDIKAYLPNFLNAATPSGWVDCNGQVLADPASPLNGKTIPDLNNGTYLVGTTGATGENVGTNNLFLTAANLPNVTLSGTLTSSSAGLPSGIVSLTEAGSHNHTIRDAGHQHGIATNKGGFNNGVRIQVSDRDIDGYIQTAYSYTGVSINSNGEHIHSANFLGNSLGSHTHNDAVAGPINGGVTQSPLDVRPNSVTVRWIMKVK